MAGQGLSRSILHSPWRLSHHQSPTNCPYPTVCSTVHRMSVLRILSLLNLPTIHCPSYPSSTVRVSVCFLSIHHSSCHLPTFLSSFHLLPRRSLSTQRPPEFMWLPIWQAGAVWEDWCPVWCIMYSGVRARLPHRWSASLTTWPASPHPVKGDHRYIHSGVTTWNTFTADRPVYVNFMVIERFPFYRFCPMPFWKKSFFCFRFIPYFSLFFS